MQHWAAIATIGAPIVTGVIGAVLTCFLYGRLRESGEHARLARHRSKSEGFMDLVQWGSLIDDGIVINKNGSLMAGWRYVGKDDASSLDAEREMVSARLNEALRPLGAGWAIHVDAMRKPAPGYPEPGLSRFGDAISRGLDEERRRWFNRRGTMYDGYYTICVTWLPPLAVQEKFVGLMFEDEGGKPDARGRMMELLEHFKKEVANLETRLSLAVKLTRLSSFEELDDEGKPRKYDDLLRHLQQCLTGRDHLVTVPRSAMWIDALLGGEEMWGGVIPRIGRKFVMCVAIDGFPGESHPGILSFLTQMPVECRWSTRYIAMDPWEALGHVVKYRKIWKQKVRGFLDVMLNNQGGSVNRDAAEMVDDAEEAEAEVQSGLVSAGYYTSVVILMDEDRKTLEEAANRVAKAIMSLGYGARIESVNSLDAFFGSLPGHTSENVRRPVMNTLNLADMLPVSTIWTGEKTAPCPMYGSGRPPLMQCATTGSSPFFLNLHVGDVGHTIVFGPTGRGKSTLLATLAAQLLRYDGMKIFAFDKGLSMYPLCEAVGGRHYAVGSDESNLAFCPLQYLDSREDRAWALGWIDRLLRLNDTAAKPAVLNEIARALESMRETGAQTLTNFVGMVQDADVREALKAYTVEGSMGHLLDAEEDGLSLADFNVFEVEELMNLGERYSLPVLLYLFRRIEKALKGDPAVIFLDEAWLLLGHDVFREKIREWLKVMRKANCAVVMATQSLSDAARSGILDVINENTATKIFLPNEQARDEDASVLYSRMGLNRREIDILAAAVPKRDYYYVSSMGRRLFNLALGPLALSFVGTTDKKSIDAIRTLKGKFGEDWARQWLSMRNVDTGLLEVEP